MGALMELVYLDNNATTPPLPEVGAAVVEALTEGFGNPSSPTMRGALALARVVAARDAVAALIGAHPESILFTSGCTEGNNAVLRLARSGPRRLVTTAFEHASVTEVARALGAEAVDVAVLRGQQGRIDVAQLREALTRPTALVSVQWANSETGVIQPIEAIAEVCREAEVPLHVDAAQAVGRLPIDLAKTPIDFLTFSGHKLHAPPGIGVVFARDPQRLPQLLFGGEQQYGRRAGTENLPGIAGLRAACAHRIEGFESTVAQMSRLRDTFEARVIAEVPGCEVNGTSQPRVCNTSNIRFPVDGQALTALLGASGIACSQTSACSSHSPEPSKVLTAMGLSRDEAFSSVRFSFSAMNTDEDVEQALEAIQAAYTRLSCIGSSEE